ncbi:unnamed protein product [Ilex paraguariensis]|uniref:CHCH domain-containing protein n=1 Tax=Ilex paraguariensis TaxID=185542 RepID=A0ABC8UZR0_9AQUA
MLISVPVSGAEPVGRSMRSASRPAARSPPRQPPQPAARAPPPVPVQGESASGGLGSVVAEGIAIGGGNGIAHRAMDFVLGPTAIKHETVASPAPTAEAATMNSLEGSDACGGQFKAFRDVCSILSQLNSFLVSPGDCFLLLRSVLGLCLNYYGSDISKCQTYMDMLSECRKNTGSGLSA